MVQEPYPTNLYEARVIEEEPSRLTDPEGDYLTLIESFPEMVEVFRYSYMGFVRFGDSWEQQEPYVWLNYDAGLKHFNHKLRRILCYLGKWERDDWPLLEREMRVQGSRTYIVDRQWYDHMQQMLLETGIGIAEEELNMYLD